MSVSDVKLKMDGGTRVASRYLPTSASTWQNVMTVVLTSCCIGGRSKSIKRKLSAAGFALEEVMQ